MLHKAWLHHSICYLVGAVMLIPLLSGCDSSTGSAAAAPTPTTGLTVIVKITGSGNGFGGLFKFDPADITIKVGTTVTWLNVSSATHTVDSTDGPTVWDSQPFITNQSYSYTFTVVGFYDYRCGIHRGMKGTITVTP
jgi:plastocyanin